MPSNNSNKLNLAILASLFFSPVLIHHTIGQIPLLNYQWIAGRISKLNTDFQKIEKLYGIANAADFQTFFITGIIFSNLAALVLLILFFWQMKKDVFFNGIGAGYIVTESRSRKNVIDSLVYLAAGCVFLFLYIWVFPTWIHAPGPNSLFEMRPGITAEWISSVFFAAYAFFFPLFVVSFANFIRN